MVNNTAVKDAEFLLYISLTLCFCSPIANHVGLVIEVVRNINLKQSIAAKSNFP